MRMEQTCAAPTQFDPLLAAVIDRYAKNPRRCAAFGAMGSVWDGANQALRTVCQGGRRHRRWVWTVGRSTVNPHRRAVW